MEWNIKLNSSDSVDMKIMSILVAELFKLGSRPVIKNEPAIDGSSGPAITQEKTGQEMPIEELKKLPIEEALSHLMNVDKISHAAITLLLTEFYKLYGGVLNNIIIKEFKKTKFHELDENQWPKLVGHLLHYVKHPNDDY